MTQEERTRDEVLNVLIANTQALTLLVAELINKKHPVPITKPVVERTDTASELGPVLSNPAEMNPGTVTGEQVKQRRAAKAKPVEPSIPVTVTPVTPSKSAADLREALQQSIAKNGMPNTKERMLPFVKLSDVPDDQIDATIARLLA